MTNSKHENDLPYRLRKLETESNSSQIKLSPSQKVVSDSDSGFSVSKSPLGKFMAWFISLSKIEKIAVLSVLVVFGCAILQAVLKLVASLIAFTLLAVLAYLGYKFVVPSNIEGRQ